MKNLARKLAVALSNGIGSREAGLLVGLVLVGYGAGTVYWAAGFFLPGVVMLYVAIAGLR